MISTCIFLFLILILWFPFLEKCSWRQDWLRLFLELLHVLPCLPDLLLLLCGCSLTLLDMVFKLGILLPVPSVAAAVLSPFRTLQHVDLILCHTLPGVCFDPSRATSKNCKIECGPLSCIANGPQRSQMATIVELFHIESLGVQLSPQRA